MREAAKLHLVNPETGEVTEEACPHCEVKQTTLDELTRKYHGALAQIGKLRADRDAEAKSSRWWGVAIALFLDWRVATGRVNSRWTAERFLLCEPFLDRSGYAECRYAVWGLAAHPSVKQVTAKHQEVYDSWELVFRSQEHFERYRDRGVAIFGADLPLTDIEALLRVRRREAGVKSA